MSAPEVILGVDFGTTNSVVAVYREDGVEVLANDIDKRTTPSCVYKCDTDRGVGEVGEAALRMATSYPANTIRNVKSVLGHTLKALRGRTPMGSVKMGQDSPEGPVALKIGKREFSPEEAVAMILLELKKTAKMQLQQEVNKAIIAVPSYFNASQRQALMDAAEMAGLEVPALVNETTAAAMAYAHDREVTKTVVMVDVGGGGCSLAVVKVANNAVEVLAHSGPRLPGGDDFDAKMVEYLKECAEKTSGKKVTDLRDAEFLRSHWAKAKEKLSRILQATISVFLPDIELEFHQEVKRNEFQMQCAELFEEITNGILRLLQNAKVAVDQVDEVLLVGGSTRIPYLRDLIHKTFNGKALKTTVVNPDEAVAQGAALMAAKCVELKREVLSLVTAITAKRSYGEPGLQNSQRNTVLPHSFDLHRYGTVEVEQEVEFGHMTPIWCTVKDKYINRLLVTKSGLLQVYESSGRIQCTLIGCLRPSNLKKQGQKVETHLEKERMQSIRIEAKNALERVLREERGRKIGSTDRYFKDAWELHEECEKKLKWLETHSNESEKEYDSIRAKLETNITTLNSKLEAERQRIVTRECLRETLQATAVAAIPEDPFVLNAQKLKQLGASMLEQLKENENCPAEEYAAQLESVLGKQEELNKDRERHATDQLRKEAIESFDKAIIEANERSNHHKSKNPHGAVNKLITLIEDAKTWLASNRAAMPTAITNKHKSFDQTLATILHEVTQEERRAEEDRKCCLSDAEQALQEAISSFQIPAEGDPLHSETAAYFDAWMKLKDELNSPQVQQGAPLKYLINFALKVREDVSRLRDLQSAEHTRQSRKDDLQRSVKNGLESPEFKNSTLFTSLLQVSQRWLNNNPSISRAELEDWRGRLDSVTSTLRSANSHRSNQEREDKSAKAALKKASEEMRAMLAELGYEFPDTQAPPPPQYAPEDFTEERMDVDSEGGNGDALTSDLRNKLVDDKALLEVWQRFHHPAGQQWLRLGPLCNFTPPQCKAMLESLSEELAVDALKSAAATRCMTLLLDRKETHENEFVSLSVRYVRSDGNPVENLLFVQDRRHFDGHSKDFAAHLIGRLKVLCKAAGVQLQNSLLYFSAPDCGGLAMACIQQLQEEKCTVWVAHSISEPLDKLVARACYEIEGAGEEKSVIVESLAVVDTIRQKLAPNSKWFPRLKRHFKFQENPWMTYTSSVAFILENRIDLSEMLGNIPKLEPKEMLIMTSVKDRLVGLANHSNVACLVALDGVFGVLKADSDKETDPRFGWRAILNRLEGNSSVLTGSDFIEILKSRIFATLGVRRSSRNSNIHDLVDTIVNQAVRVTVNTLKSFDDCRVLSLCWDSDCDRSKGLLNYPGDDFFPALVDCRKAFPQDSPQQLLQRLPQAEFLTRWPSLFATLQRVLTVPLIPPAGQRSAVQLREGILRASAVLPALDLAAVPVALRTEPPSAATLSRAVARVLERCPELPGVREEWLITMV